jgi:hypothetical protein
MGKVTPKPEGSLCIIMARQSRKGHQMDLNELPKSLQESGAALSVPETTGQLLDMRMEAAWATTLKPEELEDNIPSRLTRLIFCLTHTVISCRFSLFGKNN